MNYSTTSCDLLSNFRFTFFDNNSLGLFSNPIRVVICFQTLDLRSLITTVTQRTVTVGSCDLLSNFRFTFFDNNKAEYYGIDLAVVICFQTLDLRSLITTAGGLSQLKSSCDLLSNFRFTFFDNNKHLPIAFKPKVVICFQTLDLRSLITTQMQCYTQKFVLWFAFKL